MDGTHGEHGRRLRTPSGVEFVEAEADHLQDQSVIPNYTDYVLKPS